MATMAQLVTAVGALCSDRVFPDYAEGTPTRPYVTYQQIGGGAKTFMEGGVASQREVRLQVNVWADTRLAADALMNQIEGVLLVTPFFAKASARMARVDFEGKKRGAQEDFAVWLTG